MNASTSNGPLVLIGIGNEWRGDDGVGLLIVRRLRAASLPRGAVVRETADADGAVVMDAWQGAERVMIFDAAASGASPGVIHRLDARAQLLPAGLLRSSTHDFGLAEAIELARALNCLPGQVTVWGVEGACFDHGAGLSPEVAAAGERVAAQALTELAG